VAPVARLRQKIAYELAWQRPEMSAVMIARAVGLKNHSTVLFALCQHARRYGLPEIHMRERYSRLITKNFNWYAYPNRR
jgi:hypothetical protein